MPLTFICTGQFDKRSHGLEQSLERSPALGDFYGTGIEIWAGFGTIGSTEKKNWADYEQLLRPVFSCFHGQKKFLKTL